MKRTRKLKITVIILIVLSVSVLPTAFGVSYAKWTGGSGNMGANVNIGAWTGGSESNLPDYVFKPDAFPENFAGGMLIRDADGNPVIPDTYVDSGGTTIGFTWDLLGNGGSGRISNIADGKEIYVQFFMRTDDENDPDATAITIDNPDKGQPGAPDTITLYVKATNLELHEVTISNGFGISHETGSYWYKLSQNGYYNVQLAENSDGSQRLLILVY